LTAVVAKAPVIRCGLRGAFMVALALVSACVEEPRPAPAPAAAVVAAAPSVAGVYDCGEDGRIGVEFFGAGVRVTEADGSVVELPASPPGQRNRFGEGVSAIVIEGREALYMRARREPWTCVR
jgi:hypothetical protein